MSYRRRSSPLHVARAAAGCAYCLALASAALILSSPVALGAVVVAIAGAGLGAGVGRELRRAAVLAVPLAIVIALINALVTRNGLTVIVRLGDLPLLGHTDVTLEATVYGAILGLRALALIMCGALYTAAVDPDEVLRLFRAGLVSLGADRDPRHPHGAGARARRPSAGGRAAVPTGTRRRRAWR